MIKLAPNSKQYVLGPLLIAVICFVLSFFLQFDGIISLILYVLVIGFLGISMMFLIFFRDPIRNTFQDNSLYYAPADGKILYTKQSSNELKIAIRMSPFDVHLNRAPISGKIVKIEHQPGLHKNVYFADAEKKNERNLIIIENEEVVCEVLQLTGAFARRISCWVNTEQEVIQGEKLGIIRFGSQTNFVIKQKSTDKTIKLLIDNGQQVHAGITVLATTSK